MAGAGLSGPVMATYLSNHGYEVDLYESRHDMRFIAQSAGRSINLALSERGIVALKDIGVFEKIKPSLLPMEGRMIHDKEGNISLQMYGQKKNEVIYSVSRSQLNMILLDHSESTGKVNIHFDSAIQGFDLDKQALSVNNKNVYFKRLLGADGASSKVRKAINEKSPINFIKNTLDHGYKELTINAYQDGTHQLANDALHIWPRKSFMLIALPNLDGTFTCTLFAPLKGENSFDSLTNKIDVKNFFSNYFYDLTELVPDITDQFFNNPLSSLGFVRCSSWKYHNTFLIGDACHATVPFYGQGMNSGFEDCYLLNDWINQNKSIDHHSIGQFLQQRIIDTTAMQDLSMSNFVEMRDKTANPNFLLQKKIEDWFSEKHPDKWIPLYSMVTFSHMGYHQAMLKGKLQDVIMNDIMIKNNLFDDFDIKDLENKKIEQQILYRIHAL